jgi:putative FmdB family regulatory protein
MPIYEYECEVCRKQCEVIQKFHDAPMHTCPECGGPMHKLISQSSFVLKGTGWYVTDYARAHNKQPRESKGTPSVSDKNTGTKTKTKAKPTPAAKHS